MHNIKQSRCLSKMYIVQSCFICVPSFIQLPNSTFFWIYVFIIEAMWPSYFFFPLRFAYASPVKWQLSSALGVFAQGFHKLCRDILHLDLFTSPTGLNLWTLWEHLMVSQDLLLVLLFLVPLSGMCSRVPAMFVIWNSNNLVKLE